MAKTGKNRAKLASNGTLNFGPFCKVLLYSKEKLVAASGLEPLTPAL
jgi:hypothetical protein